MNLPRPSLHGFTIFGIDLSVARRDRHVELLVDMHVHEKRASLDKLVRGRAALRHALGIEDLVFARDPEFFQHRVRELVHEAVTHEVDEWLTFDGVQFIDPHANEHRIHR